jgi:hypothetical protein
LCGGIAPDYDGPLQQSKALPVNGRFRDMNGVKCRVETIDSPYDRRADCDREHGKPHVRDRL